MKLAPFLMPFDLYCVFVRCIIQKHLPSCVVLQKKVNKALVLRPIVECWFVHSFIYIFIMYSFIQLIFVDHLAVLETLLGVWNTMNKTEKNP